MKKKGETVETSSHEGNKLEGGVGRKILRG